MRVAKLIRDRIKPLGTKGERIVDAIDLWRLFTDEENEPGFVAALLVAKLHEEAAELAKAMDKAEEYADVLQVLMDLARLNGVDWGAVEARRFSKECELGGFRDGRFLVVSEDG